MTGLDSRPAALHPLLYEPQVRRALEEDLGRAGDITTDNVVDSELRAKGLIVTRRPGRVAGLDMALSVFRVLDGSVSATIMNPEGADVGAGDTLAVVEGPARAILTGERVALNFLGRLCGIATATAAAVALVGQHKARIACTRKTTRACGRWKNMLCAWVVA